MNIKLISLTLFSFIFSNCGTTKIFTKHTQKSEISHLMPLHIGTPEFGSYGLYDYTVYTYSVSIRATSPDIQISFVEVFDRNRDETFDSVFVLEKGVWKFASTLNSKHPLLSQNTAEISILNNYISLANHVREATHKRIQKAQMEMRLNPDSYPAQLQNLFKRGSETNWDEVIDFEE